MNDEDYGFETEEELELWREQCHYCEITKASPYDKPYMLFCKDKCFVRVGLKAIKYDVRGLLAKKQLPDMAMLVDLFCEPDVPEYGFCKSIPKMLTILGEKKYEWHHNMPTFVEKICKTIGKRGITWDLGSIHAKLLEQASTDTQLLAPWIEHVLLTSVAPLQASMVQFCKRKNVLPMLLPLTTMWRPHDYETIVYDVKFRPPCIFWWDMAMWEHTAHAWFWPRLYLYHIRLLRLMSVFTNWRGQTFQRPFADYVMRCCLGLKGTGLSALPIARIIFFCLHIPISTDEDDFFTLILDRVSKIFSVCNSRNAEAGSSCKKIKL